MVSRRRSICRKGVLQAFCLISIFGVSSIISFLAVSWKLSKQWTPDIIDTTKSISDGTYMIQPQHSYNMSISIVSQSALLKDLQDQDKNTLSQQHIETNTNSDTIHHLNESNANNKDSELLSITINPDKPHSAMENASERNISSKDELQSTQETVDSQPNTHHSNGQTSNTTFDNQDTKTLIIENDSESSETKSDKDNDHKTNTNNNTLINNNMHTSYHPEWNTINDPHLIITKNVSYDESDFSFWFNSGDGAPLFINASKYDKNNTFGYDSFVFCPIPKVGCSSWKQVMRRVKGIDAYLADDYWSLHHGIENGLEMDRIYRKNGEGVDVTAANEILYYVDPNTNKSIFHAAFVRDPLERSLSAFLDKCVQSEWTKRYWCVPQGDRTIGRYSHFDVFIEAVISRAQKPDNNYLQKFSHWKLDYHWLPQNWICDLYKFIDRYHIYNADNIMDRYNFFMNIGGNKSWNAFGAKGWFHHDRKHRRLMEKKLFVIPKYEKWEYVDTVNNIRREHPPGYRGYRPGGVLDISGSLLSENAAHAQNTQHKVHSYYRADILAKAIVFYLDDYVLFKRQLPDWICPFINVEKVLNKVLAINRIYKDVNRDNTFFMDKEKDILYKALNTIDDDNLLTFGFTSIWNDKIWDEERRNVTERKRSLEDDYSSDTKLKCFYDILLPTDTEYNTLFGVLRGTSLLLDVLLNVDQSILPNNNECVLQRKDLIQKQNTLTQIVDIYLNKYINYRLRLNDPRDRGFEKQWLQIMECFHLTFSDGNRIDIDKLSKEWDNENIQIEEQIKYNMLYSRDVPRSAAFGKDKEKYYSAYQEKLRIKYKTKPRRKNKTP